MLHRILLSVLCLALLTGFQPSELRWRSPAILTLRFMAEGMPAGMYRAAQVAASMWQNERVRIRIVDEGYVGPTSGSIIFGGPVDVRHGIMTTFPRGSSTALAGCDIMVAATPVPWHVDVSPPPVDHSDAITAFAHEMGHCLGLLHENGATPPALMRQPLRYGEYHRALPPDEVRARDVLFPPAPPVPPAARRGWFGCGTRSG